MTFTGARNNFKYMVRSTHLSYASVVRMCSVIRVFLNYTSCIDFEPVKRTTYIVIEHNGRLFLAPTVRCCEVLACGTLL